MEIVIHISCPTFVFNSNSHTQYCDWLQRQNQLLPNGTKMNWKSLVISDFVIPDLQNGQNAPKMPLWFLLHENMQNINNSPI